MKCCGQERTTKFCPDCGKSMMGSLGSLLRHAQVNARCKDRSESARAKWRTWADELEKAIAALAEKEQHDEANEH